MESPYSPPKANLSLPELRRKQFSFRGYAWESARNLILLAWGLMFLETCLETLAARDGASFFNDTTARSILMVVGLAKKGMILVASWACPVIGVFLIRKSPWWATVGLLLVPVFFYWIGSYGH